MTINFNDIQSSGELMKVYEKLFSDYSLIRSKFFSKKCLELLKEKFSDSELFLTHSATGALDLLAILIDLKEGDEVILPSFTFVSTVNAFVSKGVIPVFVDVELNSMNLDLVQVEKSITNKTKAIIVVHYAGHACDLNKLKDLSEKNNILIIEDAAMAYGNCFGGKSLGTIGDFGVISFDVTKQISSIQGGLVLINNKTYIERSRKVYEIGTNKYDFLQSNLQYYEWVDFGSKFQMSELNAAYLQNQLLNEKSILEKRKEISMSYLNQLDNLIKKGYFKCLDEEKVKNNFHEFYLLLNDEKTRNSLMDYLKSNDIESMFHYIPLHNSKMGNSYTQMNSFENTIQVSSRILRLPFHNSLSEKDISKISSTIKRFFEKKRLNTKNQESSKNFN
jgi:dTDP-4-amino-4,6-dideoxygalactose transaminase